MKEYFVISNSFAAPFFSDQGTGYVKGTIPSTTLLEFVNNYKHPAGLYSANLYESADSYHKGDKQLLQWLCNHEIGKQEATKTIKGGYSYLGHEPGRFEIDRKEYVIPNPKGGRIYP